MKVGKDQNDEFLYTDSETSEDEDRDAGINMVEAADNIDATIGELVRVLQILGLKENDDDS